MIDWLITAAALASGALGSVHCGAMCGGIAVGVASGFPRQHALRSAWTLNLGRIASYTLAGAIVGGLGAGLLGLFRLPGLQIALRMTVGAVLIVAALRVLLPGRLSALSQPGHWLWDRLQPLRRRVLPADTPLKQWLLGMLWGWIPCGLSATMLSAAWLSVDALQGAALMAAFGFGTLLTMLPLSWSGAQAGRLLQSPTTRRIGGGLLLLSGAVTLATPWLAQHPAAHAILQALGCQTPG